MSPAVATRRDLSASFYVCVYRRARVYRHSHDTMQTASRKAMTRRTRARAISAVVLMCDMTTDASCQRRRKGQMLMEQQHLLCKSSQQHTCCARHAILLKQPHQVTELAMQIAKDLQGRLQLQHCWLRLQNAAFPCCVSTATNSCSDALDTTLADYRLALGPT